MSDMGWCQYIDSEERVNYQNCIEAARKAGHTILEAEECDDRELGCESCPWRHQIQIGAPGDELPNRYLGE